MNGWEDSFVSAMFFMARTVQVHEKWQEAIFNGCCIAGPKGETHDVFRKSCYFIQTLPKVYTPKYVFSEVLITFLDG